MGRSIAAEIKRWDDFFLPQSRTIYANSRTVSERLRRFNEIQAPPLYHPPYHAEHFVTKGWITTSFIQDALIRPSASISFSKRWLRFQTMFNWSCAATTSPTELSCAKNSPFSRLRPRKGNGPCFRTG